MTGSGLFGRAALAAVFVIPAVGLQGRAPDSLADALQRTLAALDGLAQLEVRVRAGEPAAIEAVLAATEPPLEPELRDDATLVALRGEVVALEAALDAVHAGAATHLPGHVGRAPLDGYEDVPPPVATTGLDEATRRLLGDLQPGLAPALPPASGAQAPAKPAGAQARRFESEGYAADALRLAKAYYKQGRWNEALELLEGRERTAAETYWRARCLEKLGRDGEAVGAYEAVVADPNAGENAQRARQDLEFLRWRLDFETRRAKAAGKGGA
ncbi:MAG TPA: tetratricopeptide repeat protein [Planctomycetota bacterium]|nr:tetratricopeptide repeat protein [Planctomycetota bacterium]